MKSENEVKKAIKRFIVMMYLRVILNQKNYKICDAHDWYKAKEEGLGNLY
jgi:hypothetical protein